MNGFYRNVKGTSSVEFALIVMLLFLFLFGISDAARMMWHWNMAAKATHMGVRYAVVSDPPAPGIASIDCLIAAGGNGVPCPAGTLSPNPVVCTQSGCTGSYGNFDGDAFAEIVAQMSRVFNRITAANVRVEYREVGLGFSGNPYGPDVQPLVTVSLKDMQFDFITPGLSNLVSIPMPDFRASMTAEDLRTN